MTVGKWLIFLVALAAMACVAPSSARTWTDVETGRTLDAEYLRSEGETVFLRRNADQAVFPYPLSKLSEEDRAFVAEQIAGPGNEGPETERHPVHPDRYQDVDAFEPDEIPTAGRAHDQLGEVDQAVLAFMAEKGIPAVSFAVSVRGEVVHDRAFGWGDPNLRSPLPTGVSMRLASISKPITQAAIRTLIAEGTLALEGRVFEVMGFDQDPPRNLDARWRDITIEHLLTHRGGWDRDISGDSTYRSVAVCKDLGVRLEKMVPMDLVRWYLEQPLDFDPGAREAYSNFGYTLLARVVEKVSDQPFPTYLAATVAKQADMTTLRVSRSDPDDRIPGEIWYCLHPEFSRKADPFPVRMITKDGSGALACTAADYCRFLTHYAINGALRRPGGRYRGSFYGSTYGVTSACSQRPDGINFAVVGNRRPSSGADWNEALKTRIDQALEPIAASL